MRARSTKRLWSLQLQFGAVLLLAIALVLAIHSLVLVLLPQPPASSYRLDAIERAIRGEQSAGLVIQDYGANLPEALQQRLLTSAHAMDPIAKALSRRIGDQLKQNADPVHVRWLSEGALQMGGVRISSAARSNNNMKPRAPIVLRFPNPAASGVAVARSEFTASTTMLSNEQTDALFSALPLPAFEAIWKDARTGQWRGVTPESPLLTPWRKQVLATFLVSALILVPFALWSAGRLTRPLRALARATHELDWSQPVLRAEASSAAGSAEVAEVSDAIQAAVQRLHQHDEDRARLVAAIAHDLRTPLTAMRLRVENLDAPNVAQARIISDIERMEKMIERTLEYVRCDRDALHLETTDLAALLQDCVEIAQSAGQAVELKELSEPIALQLDAMALHRALANLIENAARYAGPKACIVRAHIGLDAVEICVQDQGPGIAKEMRERLLKPFERVDDSRNRSHGGAGLGLAIAASVARKHGGELRLEAGETSGLNAILRLPRSTR